MQRKSRSSPTVSTAKQSMHLSQQVNAPETQASLITHLRLLHLLHHRNRNQHRRTTWYRHFNDFRRELRKLCLDRSSMLVAPNALLSTDLTPYTKKHKPRSSTESFVPLSQQQQERVEARLRFWDTAGLVQKWYSRFSQIVADPQYAAIGLVLLGILARVCASVGMTERWNAASDGVVSTQAERMRAAMEKELKHREEDEFLGFESEEETAMAQVTTRFEQRKHAVVNNKPRGKVRKARQGKKGDAIDELFEGL